MRLQRRLASVPCAGRVVWVPDRTLWGTWLHPRIRRNKPDNGALVGLLPRNAPGPNPLEQLAVTNPNRPDWADEQQDTA